MSLPTSAGKTLMAQLLALTHLANGIDSVCYVAPMRSLGREVREALRGRLRVVRRELGSHLPDFLADFLGPGDIPDPQVDVMTPERLGFGSIRTTPASSTGLSGEVRAVCRLSSTRTLSGISRSTCHSRLGGGRSAYCIPLEGRVQLRPAEGLAAREVKLTEPVGTLAFRVSDTGVRSRHDIHRARSST